MSIKIPKIDLSTLAVGQSSFVDLGSVIQKAAYNPGNSDNNAHLRMFNDSGSELAITSDDGSIDDYIPAGAWPVYELDQTTTKINFTVIAILPNPPIQLLLCTYFKPGEKVPDSPTLGNSPVGVGGSVSTVGSTLSNEGNAAPILVIDMGDTAFADLVTVYNDGHAVWAVDQSGVKHAVFTIAASGNPFTFGQAGDVSECKGELVVDGPLQVFGTGTALLVNTGNASIGGTLGVTGNVTHSADTFLVNKKLSTSASGDLCDWSLAGIRMKGNPSTNGNFNYFGDGTDIDWSLGFFGSNFTGTGGGTFNHGCKQFGVSAAPEQFFHNPAIGGGSNGLGFSGITTTQVTVGSINAVAWSARGMHV